MSRAPTVAIAAGAAALLGLLSIRALHPARHAAQAAADPSLALARLEPAPAPEDPSSRAASARATTPPPDSSAADAPAGADDGEPTPHGLEGLDLLRMKVDGAVAVAPCAGGTARLTVDPELQRAAAALMAAHHLPEAAIVLMDLRTGKILTYATHVEHGPMHDMCTEASAPSASVFKIVTAAALVEDAHLGADTMQCYSGGEQRITSLDLVDDEKRDRWCASLAGAMGRSLNAVFARLAERHLSPAQLEAMARRFGFGRPLPFDAPVQPSELRVPSEPLEFARTAAGFWNTTLSPLQAAELSAIVARGGEAVRPRIVEDVLAPNGSVVWTPPAPTRGRRVIARETADQLLAMMERTVVEGTSRRAFHDAQGRPFLPGIAVAGKTGTLTDAQAQRFYTWFTGFAPASADADADGVAVSALVVNGPTWEVKANVVAREMLRAYFAAKGATGVTRPVLSARRRAARRE